MSETFRCDDKETLVAYLYGEIDADGRREVERHLRTCGACANESAGLQAVRQDLESWLPPDAALGFAITQKPTTVLRPSRWSTVGSLPAWAQVAAAALILAAGAAIANVQVRYTTEGVTVSTGWMAPAPAAVAPQPAADQDAWRTALVALEQTMKSELAEIKRAGAPSVATPRTADLSIGAESSATLRRVQALIDASEERQRQELALRLTQTARDWDMTRRADLMRINKLFGSLQGRTVRTAEEQAEMFNLLRRVSTQPVP